MTTTQTAPTLSSESPVRMALPSDEEAIMTLCRLLHEENGQFTMSDDKVRTELRRAFTRQGGIIGVIEGDGGLEGLIFLTIDQLWYSDDWFLQEMFNFVHPDHRRSRHAKRLIEYAKECATHLKIPLLIGVLSNLRTEAKVKLYERMLPKSGAFFLFDGSGGTH